MTTGMKQLMETQYTIAAWARETFGANINNATAAARANQEMAELIKALASDDWHPKAGEEVADVVICLVRIADNCGFDIWEEVEKKMAKNRLRKWRTDGTGCGQHIDEPPSVGAGGDDDGE